MQSDTNNNKKMLRNYFNTIFRQIRKNTTFSLINLLGLAVGMSACLVIAQFALFHLSFDNYHEKSDRIFRKHTTFLKNGQYWGQNNRTMGPLGPLLTTQSSHVLSVARLNDINYQNNTLNYKGSEEIVALEQKGIYGADSALFEVLDFGLLHGSLTSMNEPNKMVMPEKTARKYFKNPANAVGNKLTLTGNSNTQEYELIAILEDIPDNSHLQFEILISFPSLSKYTESMNSWGSSEYYTYFLLDDVKNLKTVESTISNIIDEQIQPVLKPYGIEIASFDLINIKKLHYLDIGSKDFTNPVNYKLIVGLSAVALIILVIAWINYLNLSLVKTIERLKEIGIRKAMGSSLKQITLLFTLEALVLNLVAFIVALTFVQLASSLTYSLTGLTFSLTNNIGLTLSMFLIVVIGSLVIGSYPVFMLKSTKSFNLLISNKKVHRPGKLDLKSVLVALQFMITFLLITATITVYQQLNYMKTADLGFDKNNILVLKSPPGNVNDEVREDVKRYNTLKTELERNSKITAIANAGEIPGEYISWGANIYLNSKSEDEFVDTRLISMGLGFTDFFNIELVAGRKLKKGDSPWERGDVVINEELAEKLGFENPEDAIGAKLSGFYAPLEVRGVMENHHHNSLHVGHQPIIYILSSWPEYYFIKFDESADIAAVTEEVKQEWKQIFVDVPFDFFYLDQFYNRQYQDDEQFGKIFTTFSIIAIIIASLGLFGLTSFTMKQRTKEIGIRKVLGADTRSLLTLLSKNYLFTIALAYVISTPMAYFLMQNWLENYEYHINIGFIILITPLVIVAVVSFVAIFFKILGSARSNPVESLRYE